MNVSDRVKQQIMLDHLPGIIQALAAQSPQREVSSLDIADVLAIGVAAVLDNDPTLHAAEHRTKALRATSRRIEEHVCALGEFREQHGQSLLSWLMQGPLKSPRELN